MFKVGWADEIEDPWKQAEEFWDKEPDKSKNYFVNVAEFNDNLYFMTEEEAMEYLRKNGGGTLYKKVLTMRIKTKLVEEIEKYG
jgi:hypothetical protein